MSNDNDFQVSIKLLAENSKQLRDDFKEVNAEVKSDLKEIKQLVNQVLSISDQHGLEIVMIKKQLEKDEERLNAIDDRVNKIEKVFDAVKTAKWLLTSSKVILGIAITVGIVFFSPYIPEWVKLLHGFTK
jgi:DNA repair ATPase RecN